MITKKYIELLEECKKLKTIVDDIPTIVRPFSIFANLLWASSFTTDGEPIPENKYPKQKTVLAQNFMDIKEKFDKQNELIDKLLIDNKQSKLEIDDLKLRICVLEDAMKKHTHISMGDLYGMKEQEFGKIPSRKK